ncbi:MAG: GDSL-type esterase/lipase family protein [Verrucomicrobiota bacterium]
MKKLLPIIFALDVMAQEISLTLEDESDTQFRLELAAPTQASSTTIEYSRDLDMWFTFETTTSATESYLVDKSEAPVFFRASSIIPTNPIPSNPTIGNLWSIGDSWTDCWEGTTWRRKLSQDLTSLGYSHDFIGSRTSDLSCEPGQTFDRDHDGYGAITAAQFLVQFDTIASQIPPPNTLLLMLGGNDYEPGNIATIITRLQNIITKIRALNTTVVVHLEMYGYVDTGISDQEFDQLAAAYQNLATTTSTTESPVYFVDHRINWNKSTHLDRVDLFHPSPAGMERLASNWLTSLQANHAKN